VRVTCAAVGVMRGRCAWRRVLRRRRLRGRRRRAARGPAAGDALRALHRVARAVRGPAAHLARRRLRRRRRAPRTGDEKNSEGRAFPFGALPALAALLRKQRARTAAVERATGAIVPWVFHRAGCPIKRYRRAWAGACRRAATEARGGVRVVVRPHLAGRIVHDLRRTAVRNLERAGVPRSVAMQLTGHTTESVYRRYAIVAEADLREGVAKLAGLAPRPTVNRGG
jgi:hypothetical protein